MNAYFLRSALVLSCVATMNGVAADQPASKKTSPAYVWTSRLVRTAVVGVGAYLVYREYTKPESTLRPRCEALLDHVSKQLHKLTSDVRSVSFSDHISHLSERVGLALESAIKTTEKSVEKAVHALTPRVQREFPLFAEPKEYLVWLGVKIQLPRHQ